MYYCAASYCPYLAVESVVAQTAGTANRLCFFGHDTRLGPKSIDDDATSLTYMVAYR